MPDSSASQANAAVTVSRVQLGVRMESRMVKVLKALAEKGDMTLGQLLEDIVLHAFEGESTFSRPETLKLVQDVKRIYDMDYDIHAGERFVEPTTQERNGGNTLQ